MKTMFFLNTRGEFLKSKRSFAYWLTLLAALFIPFISCIILIERPDAMLPKFQTDPWLTFLRFNWKNVAAVILPMYIILITNLIVQIEFRSNTWKQVYATPRTFADIFFSKFVVIHTLIFLFIICFNLFIVFSGLMVNLINNSYPLLFDTIHWKIMFTMTCRIYVGTLAVTAIQYWLSLRFRNFIVPLGIGIGLWITGIVLMDWEKIIYYPYIYSAFMFFTDFDKHPDDLTKLLLNSLISFAGALILSFWDVNRLRERG
jgi:hypothetical protein